MKISAFCLGATVVLLAATSAIAQTFSAGQVVYATPSNAYNDWRAGCLVGSGRSNTSYQVKCGADWMWIDASQLSATKPQPKPDPNNPDRMLIPVIRPNPNYAAVPTTRPDLGRPNIGHPYGVAPAPAAARARAVVGGSGAPPSGRYACEDGNGQQLGVLDIQGATYRGITFSPSSAFLPLSVGPNGALTFTAGLGSFSHAAARIGKATYNGTQGSSGHRPWISIDFTTKGGENERLDCERQ